MEVIQLTPKAIKKIKEVLGEKTSKSKTDEFGLRIAVIGGGCSGLQYSLSVDRMGDIKEDDLVQEYDENFRVLVDSKSALFLTGSTLEFYDDLNKSGFDVINPNASNPCGCGKSFA